MLFTSFREVLLTAGRSQILLFHGFSNSRDLRGGAGYDLCSVLTGPEFERGKFMLWENFTKNSCFTCSFLQESVCIINNDIEFVYDVWWYELGCVI